MAEFAYLGKRERVLKGPDSEGLRAASFDIEVVPGDVGRARILPEHYVEAAGEAIPQTKITAQQRLTVQQLRRLTVQQERLPLEQGASTEAGGREGV